MAFIVECGTENYRIIGPNKEEGQRVPWGTIATLKIGNEVYYCDGDPDADEQSVERIVSSFLEDSTCEDVIFDDEEDDAPAVGDVEEEEDEEDEDEEEEVLGPRVV